LSQDIASIFLEEVLFVLKHPIRRKIVERLWEKDCSFSELLDLSKDSGKLGFHLRKMGTLVARDTDRRYFHLTSRGRLTYEFLTQGLSDLQKAVEIFEKTEKEERQQNNRYRTLFNTIPDPVTIVDSKGRVLAVNDRMEEKTGFTREELLGRSLLRTKIFTSKSRTILRKGLNERIRGINPLPYQVEAVRKDDMHLPFEVSGAKTEYRGRPADLMIFRDLTERKRMEEELRNSEEKYRRLFEDSSDGLVIVDRENGSILDYNEEFVRQTGRNRKQLSKMKIWEIRPSGLREEARKKFVELKKKGYGGSQELDFQKPSGELVNIDFLSRATKIGDREVLQSRSRDISERKRMMGQIKEQNEFLNNILESLAHPFYVIDVNDYTIKMANSAARLGSLQENPTCYALTHDRDKPCGTDEHPCPIQEIKKTGKPMIVEHVHLDKNGEARTFEVHGYPIFDTERNVSQIIEYTLDITRRKQIEWMLGERLKELKCLYEISRLREQPHMDLKRTLDDAVSLLPPAWQHPEVACARIVFGDQVFKSKGFKETQWKQSADLKVHGKKIGSVEVFYLKEKPEFDEGPFLKEERDLIDTVAEDLSRIIERYQIEESYRRAR
jgi:PAS domain S-box-containing protein